MTLALKSLRLMLIASALFTAMMLVLWLGLNNQDAQTATYTNGFNLIVCAGFTLLLPKHKKGINIAFLLFCLILVIASKTGGFTITTFPAYIMTLLSFGGIGGIVTELKSDRPSQNETPHDT